MKKIAKWLRWLCFAMILVTGALVVVAHAQWNDYQHDLNLDKIYSAPVPADPAPIINLEYWLAQRLFMTALGGLVISATLVATSGHLQETRFRTVGK